MNTRYITRSSQQEVLPGEGVALLKSELAPEVERRIERIGRMWDRVKEARGRCDHLELLRIAVEYETFGKFGMPTMANIVRRVAQEIA